MRKLNNEDIPVAASTLIPVAASTLTGGNADDQGGRELVLKHFFYSHTR